MAAFARLADARRALFRSARALAAVACLCLAGPLALPAQTTDNFYLWRTTITVGENNDYLGYEKSDSYGSISTGAKFNFPPFSPPPKHHFDPDYRYTVEGLYIYELSGTTFLELSINNANTIRNARGKVTLWIRNTPFQLKEGDGSGGSTSFSSLTDQDLSVPDLDWEEGDKVRVLLVYTRKLPSVPQNVSVTAPPGEDGTLEVSWEEPDVGGTHPIEYYLVEFRPVGDARRFVRSHVPVGETSVKRTDLQTGVEYRVLVQALSGDGDPETRTVRTNGRALRAWFESTPARHDGKKRVKVRVAFSEPVEERPQNVGEHGVDVEGGEVTSARQIGGNAPGGGGPARIPARSAAGMLDRKTGRSCGSSRSSWTRTAT